MGRGDNPFRLPPFPPNEGPLFEEYRDQGGGEDPTPDTRWITVYTKDRGRMRITLPRPLEAGVSQEDLGVFYKWEFARSFCVEKDALQLCLSVKTNTGDIVSTSVLVSHRLHQDLPDLHEAISVPLSHLIEGLSRICPYERKPQSSDVLERAKVSPLSEQDCEAYFVNEYEHELRKQFADLSRRIVPVLVKDSVITNVDGNIDPPIVFSITKKKLLLEHQKRGGISVSMEELFGVVDKQEVIAKVKQERGAEVTAFKKGDSIFARTARKRKD